MSRFTLHALAVGVATASLSLSAQAATEVSWWHAMGGQLGEILEEMTEEFNASQDDYHVTPSYRGTYTETMTGAIAAFRANEQPHILQVFEVGTGTMMNAKGAIYPSCTTTGTCLKKRAWIPSSPPKHGKKWPIFHVKSSSLVRPAVALPPPGLAG